ncbi:hypothetical protein JOD54_004196 [Actinokineospora baliensis]|uniref:hypothetical protein n=1 Tax=Actinokineospora baliensis TaxID=547056 RepID=UPI00195DDB1C|nr:hypothetical protein [Actinokineospora baliensis]MBM7773992.1 hypothetical protein [Actinokineospora baliensis]
MIRLPWRRSAPAAPPPVGGLGVLDGHGGPLAGQVARALGPTARLVDPWEITGGLDCLVVVLPLRTDDIAAETLDAVSSLGSVATDPALAGDFTAGVVVVWSAHHRDRAELAAPQITSNAAVVDAWNTARLLLGTSWQRERSRHAGDETAATHCVSTAIHRMLHATTHDPHLPDVCTHLTALDAGHLHTLTLRLTDGSTEHWSGHTPITTAVQVRLARRRAG